MKDECIKRWFYAHKCGNWWKDYKKTVHYNGVKTKEEIINYALQELIKRKERKEILKLAGKLSKVGGIPWHGKNILR